MTEPPPTDPVQGEGDKVISTLRIVFEDSNGEVLEEIEITVLDLYTPISIDDRMRVVDAVIFAGKAIRNAYRGW